MAAVVRQPPPYPGSTGLSPMISSRASQKNPTVGVCSVCLDTYPLAILQEHTAACIDSSQWAELAIDTLPHSRAKSSSPSSASPDVPVLIQQVQAGGPAGSPPQSEHMEQAFFSDRAKAEAEARSLLQEERNGIARLELLNSELEARISAQSQRLQDAPSLLAFTNHLTRWEAVLLSSKRTSERLRARGRPAFDDRLEQLLADLRGAVRVYQQMYADALRAQSDRWAAWRDAQVQRREARLAQTVVDRLGISLCAGCGGRLAYGHTCA